jgi:hypothetical protein
MRTLAVILVAGSVVFATSAWSGAQAGSGIRPGYYAYGLLVYGSASYRYADGCLRWGWHNRTWYNYCCPSCGTRGAVSVRY